MFDTLKLLEDFSAKSFNDFLKMTVNLIKSSPKFDTSVKLHLNAIQYQPITNLPSHTRPSHSQINSLQKKDLVLKFSHRSEIKVFTVCVPTSS